MISNPYAPLGNYNFSWIINSTLTPNPLIGQGTGAALYEFASDINGANYDIYLSLSNGCSTVYALNNLNVTVYLSQCRVAGKSDEEWVVLENGSNSLLINVPEMYRNAKVTVMDVLGKTIVMRKVNGEEAISLDKSNFSNGLYFISLSDGGHYQSRKILMKK